MGGSSVCHLSGSRSYLYEATPEQRARYEIGGGGVSLHWPDLDEDLSVANLLAGADWQAA